MSDPMLKSITSRTLTFESLEWSYATIQAVADIELIKWGLADKGWRHVFEDQGAAKYLGQCRSRPKLIVSNSHYIDNGLIPKQIVDTIRHEIAHALDDGPDRYSRAHRDTGQRHVLAHDKTWRRWAMKVGANPRATGKLEGYKLPGHLEKPYKWMMVLIDDYENIEQIRPCRKFMECGSRYMRNKKRATFGKLYLVLTTEWQKHLDGRKSARDLEFWQDNPNCPVWGKGTPKKIGVKV
jgi:hypothetical protein